jgi:uncharacterized protein
MRILVDADACPVKDQIIRVAKKHKIVVMMFFDSTHEYENDYCETFIIPKGRDNVDFFLLNKVQNNDIVVTGDYGLASLSLTRNAFVINPNGMIYTDENIFELLNMRSAHQKIRKHTRVKGPKKRTKLDDESFTNQIEKIVNTYLLQ